jgi:hypothetical protein
MLYFSLAFPRSISMGMQGMTQLKHNEKKMTMQTATKTLYERVQL